MQDPAATEPAEGNGGCRSGSTDSATAPSSPLPQSPGAAAVTEDDSSRGTAPAVTTPPPPDGDSTSNIETPPTLDAAPSRHTTARARGNARGHAKATRQPGAHAAATSEEQDDSNPPLDPTTTAEGPTRSARSSPDASSHDEDDGRDDRAEVRHRPPAGSRRPSERLERTLPTAAGVQTRRARAEVEETADATAATTATAHRRASQDAADEWPSATASRAGVRDSRSRSQSTAPPTPTTELSPPAAAKPDEEDAWEAAVRVAVAAQERQLRRTLLSIFPPSLLHGSGAARAALSPVPSPSAAPRPASASPEPLLPLLQALCEDKAYVHAAWCRYEDDLAVHRTQNSIQRKRQRHSFNKGGGSGGRKSGGSSAAAAAAAAARLMDAEDTSSDEDGGSEEDGAELPQPPEWQWVEAPPAFSGGPRTSTASTSSRPGAGGGGGTGGFQWAPWRFYRAKRRHTARRPPDGATGMHDGKSSAAADASAAVASGVVSTGSAAVAGSAQASGGGGGVPSLAVSDVPSLPVLKVDVEVPGCAETVVSPLTPEERKGYARYVMSSGKLRHDCRDPYTFLVARAKEMRVQWERQHPMD